MMFHVKLLNNVSRGTLENVLREIFITTFHVEH